MSPSCPHLYERCHPLYGSASEAAQGQPEMDENFVTANQERLACVITSPDFELKSNGNCEDILLGICECDSGKGVDMANELYNIIQSFDLEGQIIGICADTTASNTGTYYIIH